MNDALHIDPIASVIFWLTTIFLFGVIGRYLAMRWHKPGVLGELLMGVAVGNLCYFFGLKLAIVLREGASIFNIMRDLMAGTALSQAVTTNIQNPHYAGQVFTALSQTNGFDLIKVASTIDIFSRYGVIFLLFMAGLESSVEDLKKTGSEALRVAVVGVLAPIALGLAVTLMLMPEAPFSSDLFIAATLCATSVGITARVLKELKKLRTHEAQTILGAAMIDDILGLVILAIVASLVSTGTISLGHISQIIFSALLFFITAIKLGPFILRMAVKAFRFLEPWEAKLSISFLFVMSLSWLATTVHLASIIGAFAAGMILHDGFFDGETKNKAQALSIKVLVAPLEALLAPLFFMLIGIQVKLETFFNMKVLYLAFALIIAAVIGKLVSGWAAKKGSDRLLVGIGMLPRGEVGLVFASIGRALGVMNDELFSAVILMVIVTTLLTPIWLTSRYARQEKK